MEVMMAMEGGEVEFSGCSSNTSVEDEFSYALNHWSPVAEWGTIMGDDELHDLMESMMCEAVHYEPSMPSSTTTSCPGTPPVVVGEDDVSLLTSMTTSSTGTQTMAKDAGDDKGLRTVHLLMAAAEALSGTHQSRDLARVILVRLKELLAPVSAANVSNMERLAAHFTAALQSILDNSSSTGSRRHRDDNHRHHATYHPSDVLAAFQLLQDMSPYVKFGHFTANQAILEAVASDRRVHIIDYDIMEGIQWASLMQSLASRTDGPPAPHLRITAITRSSCGGGRKGIGTVQETGRRLAAFAASIGQPFSFAQCRLDGDELFRPASVRLTKGEAVVVNCMLHLPHLPHRSSGSVTSFLSGAATLNPKIIALVEEEKEPPMVIDGEEEGFVGRFMEALHRYSAVCDAMEAGYPMQGRVRGLVERVFLRPRIVDAVERAYRCRGDGGWGEWMAAAGFARVRISCFNHCQSRLLLGLFNDGYRVVEEEHNKLVLGWKSRRLLSTSIWSPPSLTAAVAAMQTKYI